MQHIHFIGIGGAGMSGLAEIALSRNILVSGSDLSDSAKLRELKKLGVAIYIGHKPSNISESVDLVVYTSAVNKSDNPELLIARSNGIRTMRRAEFLGELTASLQTIAVAGTHGKTTTTAMVAHILLEAGLDPMISIGGSIKELDGKNAKAGSGSLAVVEADEYDRSFLALRPYIAVLTSLEAEHLDIYTDLEDLQNTFVQFANSGIASGMVVINIDAPALRSQLLRLNKRLITYGIDSEQAKYRAVNLRFEGLGSSSDIFRASERIGTLELSIPGKHNISNALAAIATVECLSIDFEIARKALSTFKGASRRAEVIGESHGVLVIDDYAHHPTEIEATLSALRRGYPNRRLLVAFEPHTFSRTRDFAEEFSTALATIADKIYLCTIYPAREAPIEGVTSDLIAKAANIIKPNSTIVIGEASKLPEIISGDAKTGDIVITLGAGSITLQAPKILKAIEQNIIPVASSKKVRHIENV